MQADKVIDACYRCGNNEICRIMCETRKVKRPFRRHKRRQVDNIKVCLKHIVSTRPILRQRCAIIDGYPKYRIKVL